MSTIDELAARVEKAGGRVQVATDKNVAVYAKVFADFLARTTESGVLEKVYRLVEKHTPWRLASDGGVSTIPLAPGFPIGVRLDTGPPTLVLLAGGAPQVLNAEDAARWAVSACEYAMPTDLDRCFRDYLCDVAASLEKVADRQEAIARS